MWLATVAGVAGLPFLAGLALAVLWLHQDATSQDRSAAPAPWSRLAELPATADR